MGDGTSLPLAHPDEGGVGVVAVVEIEPRVVHQEVRVLGEGWDLNIGGGRVGVNPYPNLQKGPPTGGSKHAGETTAGER